MVRPCSSHLAILLHAFHKLRARQLQSPPDKNDVEQTQTLTSTSSHPLPLERYPISTQRYHSHVNGGEAPPRYELAKFLRRVEYE